MVELVNRAAREVGFPDGTITAVRHQGRVERVHLEMFDVDGSGHAPRTRPFPCVSWAEAQQILRAVTREGLEFCTLPFGYVAMRLARGKLRWVTVTEKYKVPEETTQLGRIFLPLYAQPLDGEPSLGEPISACAKHGR
jgi:hypothetical protein